MNHNTPWQLWIDTGGTFTDCLALSPKGELRRVKVLSSGALRGRITARTRPNEYRLEHNWPVLRPIFNGYRLRPLPGEGPTLEVQLLDPVSGTLVFNEAWPGDLPANVELTADEEAPVLAARLATETALGEPFPPLLLRLGTTKGTNALLERKGARVALLITEGFGDLPYIGTQQRPNLFQLDIPEPSLLHVQTIEVKERLAADGSVLLPLDEAEVLRVSRQIDAEVVAIALMHAYKNPVHEQQLAAALRPGGFTYVSESHALSPSVKLLLRARTALVNAYLSPTLEQYLGRITRQLFAEQDPGSRFLVMSSAGSLQPAARFRPKDSLLSGPAGGIVGAVAVARQLGFDRILTLDMGGTSTDTAHYRGQLDYRFITRIDGIEMLSPTLAIETVAAGGGSICSFDGEKLTVGPESAGAWPGPACYGAGGPLTLTDVNLLLGKLDPSAMGIPIDPQAAEMALQDLQQQLEQARGESYERNELLAGFERIANEKMAEAIRRISVAKGFDPRDYALLAFGGAGGLHACAIAELLHMDTVLLPRDAGLLSAYGMGQARVERLSERQVLRLLEEIENDLPQWIEALAKDAAQQLRDEGLEPAHGPARVLLYCRYRGQETPVEVRYQAGMAIGPAFEASYRDLFGHVPDDLPLEVESIKVFVATEKREMGTLAPPARRSKPHGQVLRWEELLAGDQLEGPVIIMGDQATAYLAPGWELTVWEDGHLIAKRKQSEKANARDWGEAIDLELFTNRFRAIADQMGAQLRRTAFSVNVKERLDFSCALLDAEARLLVNAPHIPVHLGSLGVCARLTLEALPLGPGDVAIVNHPKYGGSHLPDITLLQGVFTEKGELIGYVINRAHHAEVGGKRPGSMPPDATRLSEEGVVFLPTYLVRGGEVRWDAIRSRLEAGPYPSRAVTENLADLNAALAALRGGARALRRLTEQHGLEKIHHFMEALQASAHRAVRAQLQTYEDQVLEAEERLDDGHRIRVRMQWLAGQWQVDFTGTSPVHPGNLNANLSIVYSALVYVLRLLCEEDIPLNEGLLRSVEVKLPPNTFLHPDFVDEPRQCPAVVGGNTEVSQRLVDTLLKAFGLAAASQGTMNNFLFGNECFGYYETIGGGTGAGHGFHGRSGVHQHMTNTRITDPEDLERVYPVRLHRFALRRGSGGSGRWSGGDGLIREIEALAPLEVTLLTQRRLQGPYGMAGGQAGRVGRQLLIGPTGEEAVLPGISSFSLAIGEHLRIETPGGGGWGEKDS